MDTDNLPTMDYSLTGPATFPRITCILSFVFSTILLVKSLVATEAVDPSDRPNIRQVTALSGFIIYVILLQMVGFVPMSLAFIIGATLCLTDTRNWKEFCKASTISVVTVGTIYWVFEVQLKVFLP